jgi:quercetin dioxygenase-like cupin family protein
VDVKPDGQWRQICERRSCFSLLVWPVSLSEPLLRHNVAAQGAPQITRTELLRKPATGIEGKEIVVFVSDVPPGAVAARHFHPGDEAIYMLQGALTFEPEGGQPFQLNAGQITFNPGKHVHQAKNASSSEPAKVLNCMLAEKGQPLATLVP